MLAHRHLLEISDPEVFAALVGEEHRQRDGLELIPSENYIYPEVLYAYGTVFANKYSEGYPGRRYYGGQAFTDCIERLAIARAKTVFAAEHANVQPLSGSPMNQAVYMAFLEPGDTVLAMDLSHGGHLTHGAPVSCMGRLFNFVRYKTDPATGAIDYDALEELARTARPKIALCGHTSYPRDYDYARFRAIADTVGAIAMADISHVGGLVAGGVMRNPFADGFDIVTTTTHKTLRGPRAGLILCKKAYAAPIDRAVFPGMQGGPHMNAIAGIAVALGKAMCPEFQAYAAAVLDNAATLGAALTEAGCRLVTGGTSNHMLVLDTVASFGCDGREAETVLDRIGLTVNKQVLPDDPRPPVRPSGIRLGSPAATTRGMGRAEMRQLAGWLSAALRSRHEPEKLRTLARSVAALATRFPVPGLRVEA